MWGVVVSGMSPAFVAGMVLSLSLIMAIGPQNAHVLRMGLLRQHLWLTVAVCVLADVVLISLGVLGLAGLGGLSDKVHGAMVGAGVLFLLVYGWQAAQRCWNAGDASATLADTPAPGEAPVLGRRQAVWSALALSWLNPHAWLDTGVLIGGASLAYGRPGNAVFGVGAAVGSLVWFVFLGGLVYALGRQLSSAKVWRAVDGLVALMMWGTAFWLVVGLV